MYFPKYDWEFDSLGIYNYRKNGPLQFYFDFVQNNHSLINGDIVEAGVYQGKSLLGMALKLKELGSNKKIYGFDSFHGFPPIYRPEDNHEQFKKLFERQSITENHYKAVEKNRIWKEALSEKKINPATISSSGNFSGTSKTLVEKKIDLLGLDNIILIDGPFYITMQDEIGPKEIMCGLMDCDLYQSYLETFHFVWPRLSIGGLIYLDEYYSLKFPGARIASDEFIQLNPEAVIHQFKTSPGEFERWGIIKNS